MTQRPLTVLWSTGPLKPDENPYLVELSSRVGEQARILPMSAAAALWSRPDVFHVHWPHQLYRAHGRVKTLVKTGLSLVLLTRLRARRTPVVLTVHNRASHERERGLERWALRRLERLVSLRVLLNESVENEFSDAVVILHGHYREWLASEGVDVSARPSTRDLILFGMLRPYKGIERLADAADAAGASLTVAGRPLDAGYGAELSKRFAGSDALLIDRHLSDAELVAEILEHRLVCLPYPQMYNSGALLFALSVGRPVLAPRSAANEAISREVGERWLRLFDGELSAHHIHAALEDLPTPGVAPDLSRRGWSDVAALHVSCYRALAAHPGVKGAEARRVVVADPAIRMHSPRNADGPLPFGAATQTL